MLRRFNRARSTNRWNRSPVAVASVWIAVAACGYHPNETALSPRPDVAQRASMNSMNSMNSQNSMNSMNSMNTMNSMNSMNAITGIDGMSAIKLARLNRNAGLVLGNTILAAPDSLPPSVNFSVLSADYIDEHCPYTSWTVADPLGANIQYSLPKFMVFMNLFEKVTVPMSGSPDLIINVDQGPGPLGPHKVYLGFAIACANLVVRPAFLSPDPAPSVDLNGNRVIRSYEQDFDYFCLRFQMTSATAPSWYCATGNLADGVTGLASKPSTFDPTTNSPATFFLNQVQWGPNVWNKHWEFPHGLGAVAARIPLLEQTGFAKDYQWNLNPNDWHASGVSKVGDYIAAVAVKTATNRNGVNISPYNTRHVFDRL